MGERGVTNAIFMAGTQAGPAVGALIVAWIISQIGWRGSFFVVGAVGFVWLAAWLIWFDQPERVRWLGDRGARQDPARARCRDPARCSSARAPRGCSICCARAPCGAWRLPQGCAVYTQYLFLTWLPSYLQTTRDISILKTGAVHGGARTRVRRCSASCWGG